MTAPVFRVLVLENEAFAWQLVKALGAVGIQSGALVRAADAFAHIRSNPQIQGVSVDFNLFGAHTGVDFAAEALAIRPSLKLVLLSANLEGARRHPQYRSGMFVRELDKPINPAKYARIWAEVLGVQVM